MAKKKKIRETTIEDYYDLRIDRIDELVAALKAGEEAEESSEPISMDIKECTGVESSDNYTKRGKPKKFNPYKTDFLRNVPTVVKALFIKWWFAGAVCFFINMGLGYYITDNLDILVLTGLVMGVVVDVLVNPALHYMESDEYEYNKYMMFSQPFKAFWTFFTNIIYYLIVIICVNYIYYGINVLCELNESGNVWMEPLLFGVFAVVVDMVFISIKNLVVYLFKRHKKEKVADV